MATAKLAPVDGREVIKCDRCKLTQFRTRNDSCRRCRQPLSIDVEEAAVPRSANQPELILASPESSALRFKNIMRDRNSSLLMNFGKKLRELREINGWSQPDLALRVGCFRTYVSKLEGRKVIPQIAMVEKLAIAFQTRPSLLVAWMEGGTPLTASTALPTWTAGLIGRKIGAAIRTLRENRDMTQRELSFEVFGRESSSLSSRIAHIENAYRVPGLPALEVVAHALRVKVSEIVEEAEIEAGFQPRF